MYKPLYTTHFHITQQKTQVNKKQKKNYSNSYNYRQLTVFIRKIIILTYISKYVKGCQKKKIDHKYKTVKKIDTKLLKFVIFKLCMSFCYFQLNSCQPKRRKKLASIWKQQLALTSILNYVHLYNIFGYIIVTKRILFRVLIYICIFKKIKFLGLSHISSSFVKGTRNSILQKLSI